MTSEELLPAEMEGGEKSEMHALFFHQTSCGRMSGGENSMILFFSFVKRIYSFISHTIVNKNNKVGNTQQISGEI